MDEDLTADGRRRAFRIFRNILGSFGAIGAWTILMGSFVVTAHWFNLAPKTPELARGAIFEHNEHGWIVYFTGYQDSALRFMVIVGMGVFFLSLPITVKKTIANTDYYRAKKVLNVVDDPEGVQGFSSAVGATFGLVIVYFIDPTLPNWLFGLARNLFGS